VRFVIQMDGSVSDSRDGGSDLPDPETVACVVRAFRDLSFPSPDGGTITVVYPIVFAPDGAAPIATSTAAAPAAPEPALSTVESGDPYAGNFKEVMAAIARGEGDKALETAGAWHHESPGDVLALVALGEALENSKDLHNAARAYGSIIDLFPARADLRRFAGERLERVAAVAGEPAHDLVVDTYEKAARDRPDHPSSHRLLAFARLRKSDFAGAFEALARGIAQHYPMARFAGVDRILREDLGLIAAAWAAREPKRRAEIDRRIGPLGATLDTHPSLRFVLNWETDANDVDFHVFDASGGHAFYSQKTLRSGGSLYADVTTGYGPECFTIPGGKSERHGPYKLQAHYYARGPMGYGMGKLEIIEHDGRGHLSFQERPYIVMNDRAFVDLGEWP
jgi:hypothetical protein